MSRAAELPQLDYAPPSRRRFVWLRRILLALLLAAALFFAWRDGPWAWRQSKILYWQRQCLRYTAPPSMVVYEEEPKAAAALLRSSPNYFVYALYRGASTQPSAPRTNAAAFVPPAWLAFQTASGIKSSSFMRAVPGATIFLHQMIAHNGRHRLVGVEYAPPTDSFSGAMVPGFSVLPIQIIPARWSNPPSEVPTGWAFSVKSGYPGTPPNVRIYAGQLDPADPSHFTIRYEMWGKTDIIDGHLGNDDELTITQRNPIPWPRDMPNH